MEILNIIKNYARETLENMYKVVVIANRDCTTNYSLKNKLEKK